MKKIFFSYPDVILAIIAVVLLGTLIGFFSWGIDTVVSELQQSTVTVGSTGEQGFDLQSAASLNFHGVSTSTLPSAVATSTNNVAPATTTASSSK